MKRKVSLITYHRALNYGSVLQAYATQSTINQLGAKCTIVDYYLQTQRNIYSILHWDKNKNPKEYEEEIKMLGPLYGMKELRKKRFDKFVNKYLSLSPCYDEFEPALAELDKYDVAISGSDQILNRNTGEISSLPLDYMRPYLVDVPNAKRVSYASSFANTTDEQLKLIGPYLGKFDCFSVREHDWKEKVEKYCNCDVKHVCDPTALLTKEEWVHHFKLKKKSHDKFIILFYTLYNYELTVEKLQKLYRTLKTYDVEYHVIAPFCEKSLKEFDPNIVECLDAGPLEFLDEIYNADFVIPESYHGLMFCINLNKRFVCPCGTTGPELRKMEVLELTGLKNRWRPNFYEITVSDVFVDFDYTDVNKKLADLRANSINYLKNAIFK